MQNLRETIRLPRHGLDKKKPNCIAFSMKVHFNGSPVSVNNFILGGIGREKSFQQPTCHFQRCRIFSRQKSQCSSYCCWNLGFDTFNACLKFQKIFAARMPVSMKLMLASKSEKIMQQLKVRL